MDRGETPGPNRRPIVEAADWEKPEVARSLGETWEGRRERRRWSNERYRMAILLQKNLAPGLELVDVGCGPGYYVPYYLRTIGPERTHLVDRSREMLDHCLRQYPALLPENLRQSLVYHLPFPDGRFDAVVNCDVLMHIPRYRDALSELYRVCNPRGGRIFLRVNLTDGATYGDLPREGDPDPDYIYWIAYGRAEFRRALEGLGPATLTLIDRICRKPLKREGDPFIADAAIVVLTRGEPKRPLRTGTRFGHLLRKVIRAET